MGWYELKDYDTVTVSTGEAMIRRSRCGIKKWLFSLVTEHLVGAHEERCQDFGDDFVGKSIGRIESHVGSSEKDAWRATSESLISETRDQPKKPNPTWSTFN